MSGLPALTKQSALLPFFELLRRNPEETRRFLPIRAGGFEVHINAGSLFASHPRTNSLSPSEYDVFEVEIVGVNQEELWPFMGHLVSHEHMGMSLGNSVRLLYVRPEKVQEILDLLNQHGEAIRENAAMLEDKWEAERAVWRKKDAGLQSVANNHYHGDPPNRIYFVVWVYGKGQTDNHGEKEFFEDKEAAWKFAEARNGPGYRVRILRMAEWEEIPGGFYWNIIQEWEAKDGGPFEKILDLSAEVLKFDKTASAPETPTHAFPRLPVFRRNEDLNQGITRALDEFRAGRISGMSDFIAKKRKEKSPIKDLYEGRPKKKRKKKLSKGSLWDDPDDEKPTPALTKHPEKKHRSVEDIARELRALQSLPKSTPGAKLPEIIQPEPAKWSDITMAKLEGPPEQPQLDENEALKQANKSADSVLEKIKHLPSKQIFLMSNVHGWYPGSVPRVDVPGYSGGFGGGFFPHAPSLDFNSEESFRKLWLEPFKDRLKEAGYEIEERSGNKWASTTTPLSKTADPQEYDKSMLLPMRVSAHQTVGSNGHSHEIGWFGDPQQAFAEARKYAVPGYTVSIRASFVEMDEEGDLHDRNWVSVDGQDFEEKGHFTTPMFKIKIGDTLTGLPVVAYLGDFAKEKKVAGQIIPLSKSSSNDRSVMFNGYYREALPYWKEMPTGGTKAGKKAKQDLLDYISQVGYAAKKKKKVKKAGIELDLPDDFETDNTWFGGFCYAKTKDGLKREDSPMFESVEETFKWGEVRKGPGHRVVLYATFYNESIRGRNWVYDAQFSWRSDDGEDFVLYSRYVKKKFYESGAMIHEEYYGHQKEEGAFEPYCLKNTSAFLPALAKTATLDLHLPDDFWTTHQSFSGSANKMHRSLRDPLADGTSKKFESPEEAFEWANKQIGPGRFVELYFRFDNGPGAIPDSHIKLVEMQQEHPERFVTLFEEDLKKIGFANTFIEQQNNLPALNSWYAEFVFKSYDGDALVQTAANILKKQTVFYYAPGGRFMRAICGPDKSLKTASPTNKTASLTLDLPDGFETSHTSFHASSNSMAAPHFESDSGREGGVFDSPGAAFEWAGKRIAPGKRVEALFKFDNPNDNPTDLYTESWFIKEKKEHPERFRATTHEETNSLSLYNPLPFLSTNLVLYTSWYARFAFESLDGEPLINKGRNIMKFEKLFFYVAGKLQYRRVDPVVIDQSVGAKTASVNEADLATNVDIRDSGQYSLQERRVFADPLAAFAWAKLQIGPGLNIYVVPGFTEWFEHTGDKAVVFRHWKAIDGSGFVERQVFMSVQMADRWYDKCPRIEFLGSIIPSESIESATAHSNQTPLAKQADLEFHIPPNVSDYDLDASVMILDETGRYLDGFKTTKLAEMAEYAHQNQKQAKRIRLALEFYTPDYRIITQPDLEKALQEAPGRFKRVSGQEAAPLAPASTVERAILKAGEATIESKDSIRVVLESQGGGKFKKLEESRSSSKTLYWVANGRVYNAAVKNE